MIDTRKLNDGDTVVLMPVGLDYQGRYQTRPAEACTEVGSEPVYPPDRSVAWGVGAVALTLAWAAFLLWIIARIA